MTIKLSCPNCKAPVAIDIAPNTDMQSFQCKKCGKYSTVNNLIDLQKGLSQFDNTPDARKGA